MRYVMQVPFKFSIFECVLASSYIDTSLKFTFIIPIQADLHTYKSSANKSVPPLSHQCLLIGNSDYVKLMPTLTHTKILPFPPKLY